MSREQFYSGCFGKVRYDNFREAKRALRNKRWMKEVREGGKLMPYRCRNCRSWHIGTGTRDRPTKEMARFVAQYEGRQ